MGRYRRYLIGLASVLVLVGAYAAAGFLAVPYFTRKSAVNFVRTHYGRTLSIGEIHFNPFTLTLDIRRVSLPDADGQTLLSFGHLRVALQLASIWRLGPSFGDILLEQPYVRAVLRPGGELNLADLGKGFPPSPPQPKPAPPPRLYIRRLAVLAGTVVFEDRTHPTPFRAEFKPIVFELRDFSTRAATGDGYALEAASPEGERLTWNGTVRLAPLASRGVFEVTRLKARTVWNYLRDTLPFEIPAGTIAVKGDYELGGGGPMTLALDAHNISVTGLGVRPRGAAADYIDVANIAVEETRVDLTKRSVNIAKVALSGGDIKVWLSEEHRLNLLELIAPVSTAAEGSTAAAATEAHSGTAGASGGSARRAAWMLAAPDVVVKDFKVSAEDRGVSPAAELTLTPLNVRVTGFNTSPDTVLDVTADSG